MDKVISVKNKVIIKKMVELPIHIAAEVLASFCKEQGGCIMNRYSTDCPFKDKTCESMTAQDWEEYLNG